MADQQHDNKDDCPEVNQHLGSVPFVIGRDGNRDGWYTSYPFPPPRICGMIRQPSAAPPHRSPNSDGVSSLPHFVWTPPRPLRAITRCKPSIREIYPAPAARGTSPTRTPLPGVARENGISARGFLARGILAHICARTPRVRNPRAEILYPRVRGRGAKFVICAEIPQVVT